MAVREQTSVPHRSARRCPLLRFLPLVLHLALSIPAAAQGPRLISESDYAQRLRGFWLAQCIANWTGLRTEGARQSAPFYTDSDWGTAFDGRQIFFVLNQNPWWADDDTDIEYVYLHLLNQLQSPRLTPAQIADGWTTHINRFIWVSNANARTLIGRGVLPPSTGLGCANNYRLMIDAQLTTEFFGLFNPGRPDAALDMADLPIRTTASGHAAHAAQFYVVLYSLASQVDPALSGRDQSIWLVQNARPFIPDSSKAADICDTVLADFLANPDPNDWERTRDLVYQRYQLNDAANGFDYQAWYESSVNFATGLMALLYGQGDLRRTIQIGTLSGWDSDNGTATMGGLLGFMLGEQAVRDAFPEANLSERFWITRTRDSLPDYVPPSGDTIEDTFTLMAERMLPICRRCITNSGGLIDDHAAQWLIAPTPTQPALIQNPLSREDSRSQNNAVRRAGGIVSADSTQYGTPGTGRGVPYPFSVLANGRETSFDGREEDDAGRHHFSTELVPGPGPSTVTLTVTYDRAAAVHAIRFVEGDHHHGSPDGGWADSFTFQARINGIWTPVPGAFAQPQDSTHPFEILDYNLTTPTLATGIRVTCAQGGASGFVTCAELDALGPAIPAPASSFDLNTDSALTIDDLYDWEAAPSDLDRDGDITPADRAYISRAARWSETSSILHAHY
ncbi:hypothetical protein PHYC_03910 [Phycisphaerales bacterium]|nr:hypothetical protein PHYC_03910 [Phycisphaerales bacterium]